MTAFFSTTVRASGTESAAAQKSDAPNCQYQKSPWVSAHGDPAKLTPNSPVTKPSGKRWSRQRQRRKSFVQLAILYSGDLIVQDVDPFAQVEQSFQEPQSRFNESSNRERVRSSSKGCCRVDRVSRTGRCGPRWRRKPLIRFRYPPCLGRRILFCAAPQGRRSGLCRLQAFRPALRLRRDALRSDRQEMRKACQGHPRTRRPAISRIGSTSASRVVMTLSLPEARSASKPCLRPCHVFAAQVHGFEQDHDAIGKNPDARPGILLDQRIDDQIIRATFSIRYSGVSRWRMHMCSHSPSR